MKKGMVSIITPSYNGSKYLDEYFEHIINQTYKNFELIFIDDGSTDNTKSIVQKYKKYFDGHHKVLKYMYQSNSGQACAVNNGLKMVEGEFLYWCDSDDYMAYDALEVMVDFLKKNKNYQLVKGKVQYVNVDGVKISTPNYPNDDFEIPNRMFERYINDDRIDCYPGLILTRMSFVDERIKNREIYFSSSGQNAQLILPITYMESCKQLDNVVYYYRIRKDSHSKAILKNYKDTYKNFVAQNDLLVNIVNEIEVMPLKEKKKYIRKLNRRFFKIKLKLTVKKILKLKEFS